MITSATAQNQQSVIRGNVVNQEGTPLSDVTVVSTHQLFAISDENGDFILRGLNKGTKVRLSINRLGCQTIDTLVNLSEEVMTLNVIMQEKAYELGPVNINSDQFNILKEPNRIVTDFTIMNHLLIFLYKEKGDQKLGLFSMNGELIQEQVIPSYYSFKHIKISCTGTIIVIGKQECREYYLRDKQLNFLNAFSRKSYDKILNPCIAKVEEMLFLKHYSNHNKVIDFLVSNQKQEQKTIATLSDSVAMQYAHQYFLDILIAYTDAARENYTEPGARKNHYDYVINDQIFNPHIINDGLWDGNMLKLMIDRRTDRMVQQYLHLESRPVQTEEFVLDEKLYIVNHIDQNMTLFDLNNPSLRHLPFEGLSWDLSYLAMVDKRTQQTYLIHSNNMGNVKINSVSLHPTTGGKVNKVINYELNRDKTGKILIYEDTLHYITHGKRFRSLPLKD